MLKNDVLFSLCGIALRTGSVVLNLIRFSWQRINPINAVIVLMRIEIQQETRGTLE